jgi:uncharacterized protein YjbJ (UPF0337 family)
MAEHSGAREAVEGTVEGVKDKAKEVVGKMTDRDDLHREGQAQQDKADAQRDAGARRKPRPKAPGAPQRRTRSARLPNNKGTHKGPARNTRAGPLRIHTTFDDCDRRVPGPSRRRKC